MNQREHQDHLEQLGALALASRLRRLADRMSGQGAKIYQEHQLDFEPRCFTLFHLLLQEGPHSVGDAAKKLGLSHAAVSQQARDLQKRAWCSSEKDKRDERRRILLVSPEAELRSQALKKAWMDIRQTINTLLDESAPDLMGDLSRIEASLDEADLTERWRQISKRRQKEEVEIIDFKPSLAKHFDRLNRQWLEADFELEPIDIELLSKPKKYILDPGGEIYFAQLEGQVIGTCALLKDKDRIELAKMGVDPDFRGKQAGRKLLDHALKRAQELGYQSIFLVTNQSLTPAVNLYRKLGFKVLHQGPHPKYRRGDLVMEKVF